MAIYWVAVPRGLHPRRPNRQTTPAAPPPIQTAGQCLTMSAACAAAVKNAPDDALAEEEQADPEESEEEEQYSSDGAPCLRALALSLSLCVWIGCPVRTTHCDIHRAAASHPSSSGALRHVCVRACSLLVPAAGAVLTHRRACVRVCVRACVGAGRHGRRRGRVVRGGGRAGRAVREPSGCLNDAPCPPCASHGASITQLFWRRLRVAEAAAAAGGGDDEAADDGGDAENEAAPAAEAEAGGEGGDEAAPEPAADAPEEEGEA
jgi:hypothetical protein